MTCLVAKCPRRSSIISKRTCCQLRLDETSCLEDNWKENRNLPNGWMAKEKQQDIKKEKVSTTHESPSLNESWKESCDLPSGRMSEEKQHDIKKDKLSTPA